MRNVIDANGEHRIASITENEQGWISISAGTARLEGREHSMAPFGEQCQGEWLGFTRVEDANVRGKFYYRA